MESVQTVPLLRNEYLMKQSPELRNRMENIKEMAGRLILKVYSKIPRAVWHREILVVREGIYGRMILVWNLFSPHMFEVTRSTGNLHLQKLRTSIDHLEQLPWLLWLYSVRTRKMKAVKKEIIKSQFLED